MSHYYRSAMEGVLKLTGVPHAKALLLLAASAVCSTRLGSLTGVKRG